MTFDFLGSGCAPSIFDCHSTVDRTPFPTNAADLVRLFSLDSLPAGQRRLVCHWHRQPDGRIACSWEPDIVLIPQR